MMVVMIVTCLVIIFTAFLQDEVGAVMKQFVDLISTSPTKVAILGPTFSNQAQVVGETARFYNLVQVSN